MPKPTNRLTRKAVLDEVNCLRHKVRIWCEMPYEELKKVYYREFPYGQGSVPAPDPLPDHPAETLIRGLVLQATYRMTDILGLE